MNIINVRSLCLSLLFLWSVSTSLSANNDRDSLLLQLLPQKVSEEVFSIEIPTSDGHHPSEFQFAIYDASEEQIAAWMRGDFFVLQGLFTSPPENDKSDMFGNIQDALARAKADINRVQSIGNFVSQFDGQSLITLPAGIKKVMPDGTQFIVAINKITLYPTHAELNVYAKVETPDMETPLYFGAPDIKFTRRGGISLGSLGLLGDKEVPIMDQKGYLLFKGAQVVDNEFVFGNYVKFDCDGLKEFNLDVDLAFSREVIVPVYENDLPDNRVIAELDVNLENGLNDILVSIDINTPFYHPDHPDVIWQVEDVVLDFSATRHDSDVAFPIAGHTPGLPPEMLDNWKGVYIKTFSVKLPDGLFSGGDGETNPQSITAYDMVIDRSGFSGYVEITPVLSLNEGNADGWGYSIDSTKIHIYRNSFVGLEFNGLVDVPLLNNNDESTDPPEGDTQQHIRYAAAFDLLEQRYNFTIADAEERVYESGMLKSTITLSPASQLTINYSEADGFEILAELHGSISVDAPLSENDDGSRLSVPAFDFHDFVISNRSPYIHNAGTWELDELAVDFGGFNLTVSDVGLASEVGEPRNVDMQFLGMMNLGANNTEISAAGGFRLQGEIEDQPDGRQKWKFKKVKMDALFVDFESPAVAFKGHIIFFEDDEQFGGGFQGKMKLELRKLSEIGDIGIEAMALFGTVDNYRYFFVDVMAKFPANLITLAGIDIRGLGGGVYVNMRQENITQNFSQIEVGDLLPDYPIDPPISDPNSLCDAPPIPVCVTTGVGGEYITFLNMCEAIHAGYDEDDLVSCENVPATEYELALREQLGVSLSGTQYVPDPTVKIGINFGIVLATTGDEEKFNANLLLNMEFNDGGSVNRVRLSGYANAMAPISWSGPSCEGISMQFEMEYLSGNNTESGNGQFTARALVFVNTDNIKGGNTLPEGTIGPVDCAPLLYAGGVDMLFSRDNWYVWLGVPNNNTDDPNNLPPFPHYPVSLELVQIGLKVSGYLDVGTQLPPFPGLPSNVAALSEFSDNLLLDEATRASGNGFAFGMRIQADGSVNLGIVSSEFHIDAGFDLMMQKYTDAYCVNTGGDLGVNGWYAAGQGWVYLDIEVKVLGFSVLDAAVAAVIQAKGPNPTYVRGTIAGRYSVMGGLKKGTFNSPFEKGTECELEGGGSPVLDHDIIGGIIPIDMAGGVFVQTQPNVSFNYPVGEIVSISEEDGPANYVVKIDEFEVKLGGETSIAGELVISENGYSADFYPAEMFEGNANYVIFATASLYPCTESGTLTGDPMDTDIETVSFVTGESIDFIPPANISQAWPANGQFNYYQGEPFANFIQLASGQDYLFEDAEVDLIVKLTNNTDEIEAPATYNAQDNKIFFDLPSLASGGAFKMELKQESGGTFVGNGSLLEMYFRVSKYNTFQDKMSSSSTGDLQDGYNYYEAEFENLTEPFGQEEIIGIDGLPENLLKINADLDNTTWWDQFSQISFGSIPPYDMYGDIACSYNTSDLNYLIYGVDQELGINRQSFGAVPYQAVNIQQQSDQMFLVTDENYLQFHENRSEDLVSLYGPTISIRYYLKQIVREDFRHLKDRSNTFAIIQQLQYDRGSNCEDGVFSHFVKTNIQNSYGSSAYECFRQFFSLRDLNTIDPCVDYPFLARELITTGDQTSDYPVILEYQYPDGSTTNFTHTLQF